ncbi:hypothetical protein DWF00_20700 [Bosea caraganae]|uniref:Pyridine nucleotide-disulfide oxidoreductase n=1 Tax=Bosea caraganae TaxID=2763117 RepID=A0A370KY65_9HYPH|nr:FAD-dependent oxidoreductase [Bosea caraganae]RDJ19917.1 hypothetical protein DWE98_27220 [Bosea caraganae]RDJ23855.1 hypothetical protein DWF00_20700 [Bosea caraganae]
MAEGLTIVGGCYAAINTAAAARAAGYAEPIRILSEERSAPYQRPPLSKGMLTGKAVAAALQLKSDAFLRENAIELHLDSRVILIDRKERRTIAADGRAFSHDVLVLATGSQARRLPVAGAGLKGVITLRTIEDATELRSIVADSENIVVIGAGFVGLEVASALSAPGRCVTVLEAQAGVLARGGMPALARYVEAAHQRAGVRLAFGAIAERLEGNAGGRIRAVITRDGTRYPADTVIVGIGITPRVELAEAAGLACNDGILVDAFGRTSDPAIFAAGECARHPNPYAGGQMIRLESVQHAQDHAKVVGMALGGRPVAYHAVPWFWSDQYDMKLQMTGLPRKEDEHVVRGDPDSGRFSIFYFRDGKLSGVDSINRPADHIMARKLLAANSSVTSGEAGDTNFDLASRLGNI